MDLYIRSQDKMGNFKSNSQVIRRISHEDGTEEFVILNDDKMNELLGRYNSKERALEVLDEIQKYLRYSKNAEINNKDFLRYLNEVCEQEKCNKLLDNISVYDMPES